MRVGKIAVDLRQKEPLSVEWWPMVRQSAKCVSIRRPVKGRWDRKEVQQEVMLQKSRLWRVRVARCGVAATVMVTAEDGREAEAVRLALQGLVDELGANLRGMVCALESVEKELAGDGC